MNSPLFPLALCSALLLAADGARAGDIEDITKAVTTFASAADGKNEKGVDGVTDGDFRVVFAVGDGAATVLTKSAYLGMIKDGKVGGARRAVTITQVQAGARFAQVSATLARPDARFDGIYTLVRTPAGWRLLQESVVMTPKVGP